MTDRCSGSAARARVGSGLVALIAIGFFVMPAAAPPAAAGSGLRFEEAALELSRQILETYTGPKEERRPKVAVLEFSDLNGGVNNVGRLLAEELITNLFVSGRFSIVERSLLNSVLEEQQLAREGIVDSESLKNLGRLLGARAIVTGTIVDEGDTSNITARVIATDTGEILGVARATVAKDLAYRVLEGGGMALSPESAGSGAGGSAAGPGGFSGASLLDGPDSIRSLDISSRSTTNHPMASNVKWDADTNALFMGSQDNMITSLSQPLSAPLSSGRVTVEFMPIRTFPTNGVTTILLSTASGNSIKVSVPAGSYPSGIARVIRGNEFSINSVKGVNYAMNQWHEISVVFDEGDYTVTLDGAQLYREVDHDSQWDFERVTVEVAQQTTLMRKIRVDPL